MNDIEIRFAELKDVEKIMELYETALEPCSNKAEREFLREKIIHHILHPSSHILTAWVGEDLASFLIYVSDEKAFSNYLKSPKVLLRTLFRIILGFYGFNPFPVLKLFKRFLSRTSERVKTSSGEILQFPNAYMPAIATSAQFRGKGIAKTLMLKAIEHLKRLGHKEFASLVHLDNQIGISVHKRLGFEQKTIIWRFEKPLILFVKNLEEGDDLADNRT
jgi:ribosomal protein S18 acetylase RimI-like enzyme